MVGDIIHIEAQGAFSVELEANYADKETGWQHTVQLAQSMKDARLWAVNLPGYTWMGGNKEQCLALLSGKLQSSL
jgi:hypothetical protein